MTVNRQRDSKKLAPSSASFSFQDRFVGELDPGFLAGILKRELFERYGRMAHPLDSLINDILGEAQKRGELDDLPGAGKPLDFDGASGDAVLGRLMKESKAKPPVVVLKEQIAESKARLADLTGEVERKAEMKVLADLETRLALEIEAFKRFG